MQDLNDLFYFVQVVAHGGFAAAARTTGVQKSTLSRHVTRLEERLRATLIYRTSRRFALTEVGAEYYRQCLVVLESVESAQRVVDRTQEEPRGMIRVVCPVGPLAYQFSGLIAGFMERFPKVEVHLKCMNRRVDLIGEGYDFAIREDAEPQDDGALVSRRLGASPQCLVASAELLDGNSAPASLKDLAKFPSLAFGFPRIERAAGAPQPRHEWHFRDVRGRLRTIAHTPRLVTDSHEALHTAVRQGLGLALLPHMMVKDDVVAGRLIVLLPTFRPSENAFYALFPSMKAPSPTVRAFLDYLTDAFPPPHERPNL